MKRFWIVLSLALAVAAGAAFYWWKHRASADVNIYQTATVARGDLQDVISATGTVEPQEVIDVGAQVAGLILEFGKDPHDPTKYVDYGTQVDAGTVLAKIDDSLYIADQKQYQAQLDEQKANLEVAKATLDADQAKLDDAENDWDRAQKLGTGEALAKTEYDSYKATYESAKAQVDVGNATVHQVEANIEEAQANLYRADQNVGYCTITSPVKGVVVDRRVTIGETVVSSLNAPSLFLIAQDLTKMQVWVSVNEADIGRIRPGMPATFEVDAFPNREFKGTVNKIRLNATMSQNVVTYTVEVDTDNSDNTLLPYLTANLKFLVNEQDNALLVPNAALRWRPRELDDAEGGNGTEAPANATASTNAPVGGNATSGGNATAGGGRRGRGRGQGGAAREGSVYVLDNGTPREVKIQLGITDGVFTTVTGGNLQEGQEIVVGYYSSNNGSDSGTTNPFAPQVFRGGGRRG